MMASTKSRSLSSRSKTTKKKVKTKLSTPSLLSEDNEPDIFKCAWTGSVKKAQRVAQHDPSELCQRDTTFLGVREPFLDDLRTWFLCHNRILTFACRKEILLFTMQATEEW
eukprot:gb/GECG01003648.1/.p1 GENE.gb/GECG01003648.1/~~gb/GECG01003648.1/.p1  ORF type:complete len:111 (+),score=6.60 gb/GECG01003648.1/:1-333(+)